MGADEELLDLLGAGLPEPDRRHILAVLAAAQDGERAAALRGQPPRLCSDGGRSQHRRMSGPVAVTDPSA